MKRPSTRRPGWPRVSGAQPTRSDRFGVRRLGAAFLGSLLVLASAGCTTNQDLLQLHAKLDALQIQVQQLQQQVPDREGQQELAELLRGQREALSKAQADADLRQRALLDELEALGARVDALGDRLNRLSDQVKEQGENLEGALRQGAVQGALRPMVESPDGGLSTDPEARYQAAYNDYLQGSCDRAILGFRAYIAGYPDTELADNALYWLGECFYRQQDYTGAIAEFERLGERYPRSDKIPSGLLKKGYALLELGNRSAGTETLRDVIRQYPGSDEANLAQQRLEQLAGGS